MDDASSQDELLSWVRDVATQGRWAEGDQLKISGHWQLAANVLGVAAAILAGATALLAAAATASSSDGLRLAVAIVGGVSAGVVVTTTTLKPIERTLRAQATGEQWSEIRELADFVAANWSRDSEPERRENAANLGRQLSAVRKHSVQQKEAQQARST